MGPKALVDVKAFLLANSSAPRAALRKNILLLLRRLVSNMVPLVHSSKNIAIDNREIDAINLYNVLELALLYELKTTKDNNVTFWSMLEYLLLHKTIKLSDAFKNGIEYIAEQCPHLHTCVGRTRGFIKKAMNERLLEEFTSLLQNNKQWYNAGAIFHSSEDVVIFRAIVQSIMVFNFQFNVDSSSNNNAPKYIATLAAVSEMQSRTAGSSYSMDRLFESLEKGVQSVFSDVDSAAKSARGDSSRRTPRAASPLIGVEPALEFGSSLVPEGLHALVSFIVNNAKSPLLFRRVLARDHPDITAARRSLMMGQTVYLSPEKMGIDIACGCLLGFLESLPEPLLGIDLYSAFISCQDLDEDADRVRNLSLLCQQSPSHHWPLLAMLLSMLNQLYANKASNKLSLVALSSLAAPALLRGPDHGDVAAFDDCEHFFNTSRGSTLVCFLIQHCESVLRPVNEALASYEKTRQLKLERVRTLQAEAQAPLAGDGRDELVAQLFGALELTAKKLGSALNVAATDAAAPATAVEPVLLSTRLRQCGLAEDLNEFDAPGGRLAMTSLLHFLCAPEYAEIAATMACSFARERSKFCGLARCCIDTAHLVRCALRLDPRPGGPAVTDFAYSFLWDVLYSSSSSYQEISCMCMLIFDDAWKDATERQGRLPAASSYGDCLRATSSTLEEILHMAKPKLLKDMFDLFYKKRSLNQRALAESMLSKTAKLAAGFKKTLQRGEDRLSTVLDEDAFDDVRASIPNTFKHYQFRLLYRLSVHGSALSTLYARARAHSKLLLVVKDTRQCVLGALITSSLAEPRDRSLYYGNSLTSVFTFKHGAIHQYASTNDNSYFLLANSGELCVGAENPAIHLTGADLCQGHSRACETFGSPPLASAEDFTCVEVELFALAI